MKKIFLALVFLTVCGFSIDQQLVDKAIYSAVQSVLAKYEKIDIKILQRPEIEKNLVEATIEVNLPENPIGLVKVPVVFKTKNEKFSTNYMINVIVFDEVLTLSKALNRKETITSECLDKNLCDITLLLKRACVPYSDFSKLQGMRTKKYLKKGQIIYDDEIEKIPAILENQEVELKLQSEPVLMSCRVIALEEGNIGDEIKVMHPSYKKIFKVRVEADDMVVLKP